MLSIYEKSKLYSLSINEFKDLIEMLDKIVAALKLNYLEVEYLVFSKKIRLMEIVAEFDAEKILVFGAEVEDLNLNMILKNYKVHEINNIKLLMVNDIIDVYGNQNLKTMLWKQLKSMF